MEKDCELEILFACEAGSRAWGLEDPISDFDVRFIYRYPDLKKYLSLNKPKATLEFLSPFDASGYDIYKAFDLISRSNPGIYEWAWSPVIYKDASGFSAKLKQVIEKSYSPFSLFKHYGSLSRGNVKESAKGSYSLKKQKQLLQALRAELIRIGIVMTKSTVSPFELLEIAGADQPKLYAAWLKISKAKKENNLLPLSDAKRIIELLELSLQHTEGINELPTIRPSIDVLDEWIWEIFGIS
jgi:predicted nucleotidyltransferase